MATSPRVLFTGITGLLGRYFLKNKSLDYQTIGIANKNLQGDEKNLYVIDITDKQAVLEFIKKINPQIIVHAASIGDVDYCEKNPEEAREVNVEGTKNIVEGALSIRARLIFTSSNAIYDGVKFPFNEESTPNPIDVYGKTKVEGEELIKKSGVDYVILRLMTMYGWSNPEERTNPVEWIVRKLEKKEKINLVGDIYNNHLWAGQAAEVIWKVIVNDIKGKTYNIAGRDCISRYELGLRVAKIFGLNSSLISEVDSSFFKSLTPRPKNTCFLTEKMKTELGINPLNIEDGLSIMKKDRND